MEKKPYNNGNTQSGTILLQNGESPANRPVSFNIAISEQIRQSRKNAGLTLKALADKLGWKYQLIQRIEKDGKCSVKSLQAISNALQQGFWIFPENISK